MRIVNFVVALVLRSPLHRMMSGAVLLITVTGRRSGARYTTPVQYAERDDALYIVSRPERTWWRNLRGGAAVEVLVRGRRLAGTGEVLDGGATGDALAAFAGTSLARVAQRLGTVFVRVRPGETAD